MEINGAFLVVTGVLKIIVQGKERERGTTGEDWEVAKWEKEIGRQVGRLEPVFPESNVCLKHPVDGCPPFFLARSRPLIGWSDQDVIYEWVPDVMVVMKDSDLRVSGPLDWGRLRAFLKEVTY